MQNSRGFTIIESLTAIAIFGIILAGVLGLFSVVARSTKAAREQTILAAMSASKLETMRNLPYSDIGTASGSPNGILPDFTAPDAFAYEGTNYEIYYEVTYIDDPSDGTILASSDPAPNDYKQIKMYIQNMTTSGITSFVTNVSPKGLEGITNAGALMLKVIDASGQPVADAVLNIRNTLITPNIHLVRQTNEDGEWIEVGLPAWVNGYEIIASKSLFSADYTYPIDLSNPNPIKPHATINVGAITSLTFAIDLLSDLNIQTLNSSCAPISGVDVRVLGSKLIGTAPDVLKYDQDHTSIAGSINLDDIEWDVYLPSLVGGVYTLYGTSPIQQVNVLPGASQNFTMILGPSSANSLLVIVKNAATGAPIEGASVTLSRTLPVESDTKFTGGSVWNQGDWSGGSGQTDYIIPTQYFTDDGNVDNIGSGMELATVGASFVPSGQLTSSSFDTGGASGYTTLEWEPTSQTPSTSLKFQVASNNDNLTWNFIGPDGTAATYYTVSGTSVHASHSSTRYIRYRAFMETTDSSFTPNLTNVNINYISGCNTPGQVIFPSLAAGNNYDLDVSGVGYSNYSVSGLNISGNQTLEVLMTP